MANMEDEQYICHEFTFLHVCIFTQEIADGSLRLRLISRHLFYRWTLEMWSHERDCVP